LWFSKQIPYYITRARLFVRFIVTGLTCLNKQGSALFEQGDFFQKNPSQFSKKWLGLIFVC